MIKIRERKVRAGGCHTNTHGQHTHTPLTDSKKTEKKGAQRMWHPLCFHFTFEMRVKKKWCACAQKKCKKKKKKKIILRK